MPKKYIFPRPVNDPFLFSGNFQKKIPKIFATTGTDKDSFLRYLICFNPAIVEFNDLSTVRPQTIVELGIWVPIL